MTNPVKRARPRTGRSRLALRTYLVHPERGLHSFFQFPQVYPTLTCLRDFAMFPIVFRGE
jgi:hypothetical protein